MIELQIKNWDDFNPRKDVKSASWFRFDNSFFTNPTFFNATSDTKIIWCYLLCCASQKMSGKIKISKEMISPQDRKFIAEVLVSDQFKVVEYQKKEGRLIFALDSSSESEGVLLEYEQRCALAVSVLRGNSEHSLEVAA